MNETLIENSSFIATVYDKKLGGQIIHRLSQDLPNYNCVLVMNDERDAMMRYLEIRAIGIEFDYHATMLQGYVMGFISNINLNNCCTFCKTEPIMPTHQNEMTEIEPQVRMCVPCLNRKYQ